MNLTSFYKLILQCKPARGTNSLFVFKHRSSKTIRLEIQNKSGDSREVDLPAKEAESLARTILSNVNETSPGQSL
jgi:hypothetical protein